VVRSGLARLSLKPFARPEFGVAPTATVSPFQGLTNGQTVWVSGKHFPAGDTVAIVQCNGKAATQGQAACDISHPRLVTVTRFGHVPARSYMVVTGTIGTGAGAGPCDHTHPCVMVVADIANQAVNASAPIFFAP
jgi:hypothetical protein